MRAAGLRKTTWPVTTMLAGPATVGSAGLGREPMSPAASKVRSPSIQMMRSGFIATLAASAPAQPAAGQTRLVMAAGCKRYAAGHAPNADANTDPGGYGA